jgi:Protein of unknown function (DUF732)
VTTPWCQGHRQALLTAGTLGIAAIIGAGAANADAADDAFVASLAQAGIPQIKPELEITAGHAVCQNLNEGASPGQLVAGFEAKRVFATKQQNEAMIFASMTAYCPQHLPR